MYENDEDPNEPVVGEVTEEDQESCERVMK